VYNVSVPSDLRDSEIFRRAFNDHHRAVYTAAFRIVNDAALAQDVVQDVFLRLWRRPDSFDPARGDIGTYLRLLGRSRALDLWREGQVRGRAADRLKIAGGTEEPRVEDHPGILAERDQDRAEVREALGKLPEAQREAIVLAYWGGLTADQIARRAHVPLGTAKSRIRLGLARLREEFPVAA
jgi:RNA polymerase sigma-70 factor (ECF subfamily)